MSVHTPKKCLSDEFLEDVRRMERKNMAVEWLHVDGDKSLPVQLDMQRVLSALELPFTDPDTFWKLS